MSRHKQQQRQLKDSGERVPPHSVEAEEAVIGGVLLDARVLGPTLDLLTADDFYLQAHQDIVRVMADMHARHEPVDLLTLAEALRARGSLAEVGGASYLAEIADKVPTAANVGYYARIVHQHAVCRGIIQAATDVALAAYEGSEAAAGGIQRLVGLSERRAISSVEPTLQRDVLAVMPAIEHLADTGTMLVPGVTTGMWELDTLTGGLRPGDLTVVGGRPGMGKTSLGVGVALHAARESVPVLFVSCEMSKSQIVQRVMAQVAEFDVARLWRGPITGPDFAAIDKVRATVEQLPIRLIDHTNDWDELVPLITREVAMGVRLVVIDYLGKLRATRGPAEYWERIVYITGDAKERARRWGVPVVMLAQLKRESARSGGRPQVHELGGGGCVEADADNVILIYREDEDGKQADEAELILAKHRNGPTDIVRVLWRKETAQFLPRFAPAPIPIPALFQ